MSACPLCRERKGKRRCPARDALICSPCCGAKRLVEIDCPSDCRFLTGAHAPGWNGAERGYQRDLRRLAPHVRDLSEARQQLSFLAVVGIAGIRAARRDLTDAVLREAVVALRRTVETRTHGVLFEHAAGDARAQGIVHELQAGVEAKGERGQPVAPDDADLLAALRALEAALAATLEERAGATAFLDTATRLAARFGARPAAAASAPRIVLP